MIVNLGWKLLRFQIFQWNIWYSPQGERSFLFPYLPCPYFGHWNSDHWCWGCCCYCCCYYLSKKCKQSVFKMIFPITIVIVVVAVVVTFHPNDDGDLKVYLLQQIPGVLWLATDQYLGHGDHCGDVVHHHALRTAVRAPAGSLCWADHVWPVLLPPVLWECETGRGGDVTTVKVRSQLVLSTEMVTHSVRLLSVIIPLGCLAAENSPRLR